MLVRRGAAAEENPSDRVSIAGSAATASTRSEAIRLALRELGYIEGQNIAIEYRYAEGKRDRFPELAAELVRLKVDIIVVAGGNRIIPAAKNATKTIPIVMTGGGLDPVEAGFVESLARPGGNVTGLTDLGTELGGKRLELLKEAVPKVPRVAVLYDPANPSSVLSVKEVLPVAARALGLTLRLWEVRDAGGFERVFAALNKERSDGLYVFGGQLLNNNQKRTAGFALKSRLPSMYQNREAVDAGASCPTSEGKADRLPGLAAELVRLKVDIIVSGGPTATRSAKEATSTIPIVMAFDNDPVGSGFVASLARPGGNITGLSTLAPEISGKQLELLKEIVPRLSRVGVLGTSTNPGNAQVLKEMELAAGANGVQLQYLDVRDLKDIETAFQAAIKRRADALVVLASSFLISQQAQIAELAIKSRLPAIYERREYVEVGGLMAYGVSINDLVRAAATLYKTSLFLLIVKGAAPAAYVPVDNELDRSCRVPHRQ